MGALDVGKGCRKRGRGNWYCWVESAVVSMGVRGGFTYPRNPVSLLTYVRSDDLMSMNSNQMRTMLQIHAMQIDR